MKNDIMSLHLLKQNWWKIVFVTGAISNTESRNDKKPKIISQSAGFEPALPEGN